MHGTTRLRHHQQTAGQYTVDGPMSVDNDVLGTGTTVALGGTREGGPDHIVLPQGLLSDPQLVPPQDLQLCDLAPCR